MDKLVRQVYNSTLFVNTLQSSQLAAGGCWNNLADGPHNFVQNREQ